MLSPEERLAEARLVALRPTPEARWVEQTADRLFAGGGRIRGLRAGLRPFRIGAAIAAGLAAAILGLALVGNDPFSSGSAVRADDGCRSEKVVQRQVVPRFKQQRDGEVSIVLEPRDVQRTARVCGDKRR